MNRARSLRHLRRPLLSLALSLLAGVAFGTDGQPPIEVTPPRVALEGIATSITVKAVGHLPRPEARVEVRDRAGRLVAEATLVAASETKIALPASEPARTFVVALPEFYAEGVEVTLRRLPGWTSLLPPLLAILLALLLRQVIPALLVGVWAGAWLVHGGALIGALRSLDHYLVQALGDPSHVSIVIFSLMLGGMVGVMARSGGTHGLVDVLTPHATTARRGQVVTWLLGLAIFFDDYANTLLVGNTMRPVTDRLRISREKLAYIVDSTAAPVACLALISTWIGYEVSMIGDALRQVGSERDAYAFFVASIPYNFYPILALVFGLMVSIWLRDFGPMLAAELRANRGKVLADGAMPLADFDAEALAPPPGKPRRWINAALPVLVVLGVTFCGLWMTGRGSLAERGDIRGAAPLAGLGFEDLGAIFGAGDSLKALLWASAAGSLAALVLALGQRILSFGEALGAWIHGVKSMTLAILILLLAWSIAAVCVDLDTSGFMVQALTDVLDPRWLPSIVFALAAVTAFATGTSWGTMGILIPLAVPTAFGMATSAGLDAAAAERILLAATSAVLAGAIFGDHCSPISDTTVLSSMSSGCDHLDHVRTQLPYALVVAGVALVCGYVPVAFGLPPALSLLLGAVVLAAILRGFGRPSAAPPVGANAA